MEYLQILLIVVGWFALQKWILPKMGISTWMEPNACRVPAEKDKQDLQDLQDLEIPPKSGSEQSTP